VKEQLTAVAVQYGKRADEVAKPAAVHVLQILKREDHLATAALHQILDEGRKSSVAERHVPLDVEDRDIANRALVDSHHGSVADRHDERGIVGNGRRPWVRVPIRENRLADPARGGSAHAVHQCHETVAVRVVESGGLDDAIGDEHDSVAGVELDVAVVEPS
jgi:hypothetical protein